MIVLLYILLGWFILGLLFKLLTPWLVRMVARYAQRRMERQMNEMFNTTAQNASNRANTGYNTKRQPEPSTRSKKIDPEVGEYVHFEEVGTTDNTRKDAPRPNVDYKIEDQVVDIDWEDIPDKK